MKPEASTRLVREPWFWFVLILGTVLRVWDLNAIPFSHDEFSALYRLNFKTFYEFINKGIKHDTHPAFVQSFLWVWVKLFGMKEWVVKLPFIIAGCASLVLIIVIGKKWFSSTSGLLSASVFCVLQSAVYNSQTARPYAFGLLFYLLVVWAWTEFNNQEKKKYLIIYVISILICATTHYFSLLSAVIFSGIALFYTSKKLLKPFIIAGITSAVLFLPHLPITLHQLGKGGIGTVLSAPDKYFLLNYFSLTFHHSIILITSLVTTVILIWTLSIKQFKWVQKYLLFALLLFSLPIVIGSVYSHIRAPVLMERSLYFSLPFLFLALFGIADARRHKVLFHIVGFALCIIGAYSLIFERKHYDILYKSGYDYVLKDAEEILKKSSASGLVMISGVEEYLAYSADKNDINQNHFEVLLESCDTACFRTNIQNLNPEVVLLGRTMQFYTPGPEFDHVLISKGYKLKEQKNYFNSDLRYYTKQSDINLIVDSKSWLRNADDFEFNGDRVNALGYLNFEPEQEFGLAFTETMDKLYYIHPNRELIISVIAKDLFPPQTEIVLSIMHNDKLVYYNSVKAVNSGNKSLSIGLRLADIDPWFQDYVLRTYVWNKAGGKFEITDMHRIILPGNPLQYAITEPIFEP